MQTFSRRRSIVLVLASAVAAFVLACGTVLTADGDGVGKVGDDAAAGRDGAASDSAGSSGDADGANGATDGGADGATDGGTDASRIVFVTRVVTAADMSFGGVIVAGGPMGRDAADVHCTSEAFAAGLNGPFRAWLSTTTAPADAIARLPTGVSWSLRGGARVFDSRAAIVSAGPKVVIDQDAKGVAIDPLGDDDGLYAWTNTEPTGVTLGAGCFNWTSQQQSGASAFRGRITDLVRWSKLNENVCSTQHRVYCFGL